jgi:hypothetical protein
MRTLISFPPPLHVAMLLGIVVGNPVQIFPKLGATGRGCAESRKARFRIGLPWRKAELIRPFFALG